uniref:DNA topoisomerase I n=1 Tax=Gasterosteus aculeatus aculeatus TaxID=481459 RepID=A0AAQ4R734_GASAC|nr:DNA topoisomerase I, mitochondrial isoform X1 [Gasterosteus aculeatus aculeatus]
MARKNEAKENGKARLKAKTPKKRRDYENDGATGYATWNSAKSTEATQIPGRRTPQKKVKTPKTEPLDSAIRESVKPKQEGEERKGIKRKRVKEKLTDDPSHSTASHSSKKESAEKEEKEVGKRRIRRTKRAVTAARLLKIQKQEEEQQQSCWRWWEEKKYEDGVKWKFLEHNGPYFPPDYQPLPDNVHFFYDGMEVKLSPAAEEVAVFFGRMLDHEYTFEEVFQANFLTDWRKEMVDEERLLITDLDKCDFREIHTMHKATVEAKKNSTVAEKLALKEANQKILEEYGYCLLDHHKERIGNFKIEPPGLFRGRGGHPKKGMLKKRIQPEDVTINCSSESRVPVPPAGHSWKQVRHDNTVTWLASWTENIQGVTKYIMLNANSKLKGEKDWEKYEMARKLKLCVDDIRNQYLQDLKSEDMVTRQRAVALYFIDKLALRAENEKEEGETADTVGCCSLRVEHVTLHKKLEGNKYVVELDFLGKDSIRYYNKVSVIKKVFKNLNMFLEDRNPGDELFGRLNTIMLNKHLSSLMTGLTARVFRTYNASITLQEQLKELTNKSDNEQEKLLCYNKANRAVAILCNHQRALPKTFEQSMANLQAKIDDQKKYLALLKTELKQAKKKAKTKGSSDPKLQTQVVDKKAAVRRCKEKLLKLDVQAINREENKQIALGTSKVSYLDPRITVAWCKNMAVRIEKIYNKAQRDKFAWAINMTEDDFEF